jgi:hypothetical protein
VASGRLPRTYRAFDLKMLRGTLTLHNARSAMALDLDWPDVYQTPGYGAADSVATGAASSWELALWSDGHNLVMYCYHKRPVTHHGDIVGYDLVTPYGYSGPTGSAGATAPHFASFRAAFLEVCAQHGYAAEFIRFSPLQPAAEARAFEEGCKGSLVCWRHQSTIAIDLANGGVDGYWARSKKNHKRSVEKAQKLGYAAEVRLTTADDVAPSAPFARLYTETMRRRGAKHFYHFPPEYYTKLLEALPSRLFLVLVRKPTASEANCGSGAVNGGSAPVANAPPIAAAALYMHFGARFHYHLGGSDASCLQHGVNNLLHDAAARFGCETLRCAIVHLGGGLQDGDGLYAFKRAIGDVVCEWRLGKSILDQARFDKMIELRAAYLKTSQNALLCSKFHPAYRDGLDGNELAPPSRPAAAADDATPPSGVRLATLGDLPALLELEAFWRSDALAASEAALRRRIEAHPAGQFVATAPDGRLLGAIYTQRVASYDCLLTTTRKSEHELHTPSGPVVQLLGVIQRPESSGIGDLLRRHALHTGRLDPTVERACAVTRCRNFDPSSCNDYEAYVFKGSDPGLLFHSSAGASVCGVVPNYRPGDGANLGHGVMICYEHHDDGQRRVTPAVKAAVVGDSRGEKVVDAVGALTLPECESVVCAEIVSVNKSVGSLSNKRHVGFMDIGLDSLDVASLMQNLNRRLGLKLREADAFEHPNLAQVGRRDARSKAHTACGLAASP